jgi:hypothetical protein
MTEAETFLGLGGTWQERYEDLRAHWLDSDGSGVFTIMRKPRGRRLLHFGVLGLLDEDPTGGHWFGEGAASAMGVAARCTRVLLAAEDGDVRVREAYRCILGWYCNTTFETKEKSA